ncbi:phage repressor protein [Halobacterium litoreum]|uniref:Phage PhiH1 repressor protein n=1 Tax=Halobacterium litoreum TaxID=2039234 RepID=A0ABD5NDP4_9EURY|nr:phage repressor protein [Halobacterium litoreum]UHH13944.1 phage repressor protein [Halobacterium litoreum]
MHRQVAWLKPSDRPILVEIREYGGWVKPATLGLNVPYTQRHVATRCRRLADHEFLERHSEPIAGYRLTDRGRAFLDDELAVEDLDDRT